MNGLFGRQSGTTAGYSYSAANKNMAVTWGENTLYDYLLNPKKVRVIYALESGLVLHFYVSSVENTVIFFKWQGKPVASGAQGINSALMQ